jgi:hypothetical protein
MKTSLWVIIVLVTGIVGFLMGYSISATTGVRGLQAAHAGPPSAQKAAGAPGASAPPGEGPAGYGSPQPAAEAPAYGAPQAAPAPSASPQNAAPSAAGY